MDMDNAFYVEEIDLSDGSITTYGFGYKESLGDVDEFLLFSKRVEGGNDKNIKRRLTTVNNDGLKICIKCLGENIEDGLLCMPCDLNQSIN